MCVLFYNGANHAGVNTDASIQASMLKFTGSVHVDEYTVVGARE